jgi:SAM-dependent methyltransferase
MDQAGNVRSSHSRKFRQINRFLEFVEDLTDSLPTDRLLHVVDFGCGKSYLTFAVQHLLTVVQGRRCRITGLDRRRDVVAGCQDVAERLGLTNLEFRVGDIASFVPSQPPDLVISLHACDTATDDALAQAIRWSATGILAVPCCQQELQKLLPSNPLPPLTSWGIARERFCALTTDTHRAALLDAVGYHTQLLEFIDMEHTPKNLLLRAVRVQSGRPERLAHEQQVFAQATEFRRLLRIPPLTLERLLSEHQLLPVPAASSTATEAGRPL